MRRWRAIRVCIPCFDLHQHLRQVAVRGRSADQGNIRRALENLFAFLLGHASEHAERLALLSEFLVVVEADENLLLGLVADGAGIVEDEFGFFDRLGPGDSPLKQASRQLFRSRGRSSDSQKSRGKKFSGARSVKPQTYRESIARVQAASSELRAMSLARFRAGGEEQQVPRLRSECHGRGCCFLFLRPRREHQLLRETNHIHLRFQNFLCA